MPTDAREIFAKNLCEMLERKGKTQADISRVLNVSTTTVSNWCLGIKYPRVDVMQRLADYFGVTMSVLTSENGMREVDDMERLEALHRDPKLGMLFDRTRKMDPAAVDLMLQMADRIVGELNK